MSLRLRTAVPLGLVIVVGLAGVSSAASPSGQGRSAPSQKARPRPAPKPKPKVPPLCNLVVGVKGGEPGVFGPGSLASKAPLPYSAVPLYDSNLDILSADVANNATMVSVVIRLAKLTQSDLPTAAGRFYQFSWSWTSTGVGATMSANVTPTGVKFSDTATGEVDYTKSEIRINQPIDSMSGHPLFAPTDKMRALTAEADYGNPAVAVATTFDTLGDRATSDKVYPVGAPSCVKIGG